MIIFVRIMGCFGPKIYCETLTKFFDKKSR
nr:MAG TPA: hypothetical protein [Caudoviricetes sp.]